MIGVVLVVLVGGFFAWRYFSSYESTDDAQVDGHLMPLSARISGYVTKVNVDDNQYVQAGTVLAEIDPRDYQVALDQAQANLADAEAQAQSLGINVPITSINTTSQTSATEADVENAKAGISAAQQQYDAAQAQLVQAQANDVKAQNDLVRYKQLVDKQEVSQQQYDQAVATAHASTASVSSASASASAAEQQVHQARARLLQAQATFRVVADRAATGGCVASPRTRRRSQPWRRSGRWSNRPQLNLAIHKTDGAGGRHRDEKRGNRDERAAGAATVHDRAARFGLGHGELQRDAAEIHAARTEREDSH